MRNNLINARKHKGFTQIELADKIGVTERHYQNLEAGTSEGSVKVWRQLKKLLRAKSIDFLLEQEESTTK